MQLRLRLRTGTVCIVCARRVLAGHERKTKTQTDSARAVKSRLETNWAKLSLFMRLFHSTDPRFNSCFVELSQGRDCTTANYLWPRLSCTSLSDSDALVSVRDKCWQKSGRRYARSYPCWPDTAAHAFERYLACSGDGHHLDISFSPLSLFLWFITSSNISQQDLFSPKCLRRGTPYGC